MTTVGTTVRVRRSAGLRMPEVSAWLRVPVNVDPPGGWGGRFFGNVRVKAGSAGEMVDMLLEELVRLGRMPGGGVDEVLDEVNRVMCSRVGVRCRGDVGRSVRVVLSGETAKFSDNVRKVWSPKEYGSAAWTMMHLHPLVLPFKAVDFRNMIALVRRMLHPGVSCGCRECWEEFEGIIRRRPVGNVVDARGCGEWVWMVHAEVGKRLGRPEVSWADCVDMWGYPAEWKQ